MKIQISDTATQSRKYSIFSKFKDSNRVTWSHRRNNSNIRNLRNHSKGYRVNVILEKTTHKYL